MIEDFNKQITIRRGGTASDLSIVKNIISTWMYDMHYLNSSVRNLSDMVLKGVDIVEHVDYIKNIITYRFKNEEIYNIFKKKWVDNDNTVYPIFYSKFEDMPGYVDKEYVQCYGITWKEWKTFNEQLEANLGSIIGPEYENWHRYYSVDPIDYYMPRKITFKNNDYYTVYRLLFGSSL